MQLPPPPPVSTEDFPVGGAGAGTGASRATFADIIGPAQEHLALLRDTELTENRISEIIAAQGRLKRDLSAAEREALVEVNTALDVEQERLAISAEVATLKAQAAAGGRETEDLRVQVAYLEDLADGGREYAEALAAARREQEGGAIGCPGRRRRGQHRGPDREPAPGRAVRRSGDRGVIGSRPRLQLKRSCSEELTAEEQKLVALLAEETSSATPPSPQMNLQRQVRAGAVPGRAGARGADGGRVRHPAAPGVLRGAGAVPAPDGELHAGRDRQHGADDRAAGGGAAAAGADERDGAGAGGHAVRHRGDRVGGGLRRRRASRSWR